ncbi:MAG: 50S ribosomal protein L28 [Planctomycetia bacterium]|nr:50S ribosomal protein L28 [Planctomycetia bacterium]
MARECEICGKGPQLGNQVTIRGKAKYLGGVGTKITGITRRQFRPNLQRVRVTTPKRQSKTMLVCTKCLKSGAVVKRVKAIPFRLPNQPKPAAGSPKAPATKVKAPAGKAKAAAK